MKTYRWVCHVCEAVNSPESSVCSNCNFPAEASGEEIDAAIKQNPKAKSTIQSNLSTKQKAIGFIAIVMTILGGFIARFSFSSAYIFIGFSLFGFGLLILKKLGAAHGKSKN